jgi:hypothetical protein
MSKRSDALAVRLEDGALALATFASNLTDTEWQARVPKDGRKFGVLVHHVATMYPIEIQSHRLSLRAVRGDLGRHPQAERPSRQRE